MVSYERAKSSFLLEKDFIMHKSEALNEISILTQLLSNSSQLNANATLVGFKYAQMMEISLDNHEFVSSVEVCM